MAENHTATPNNKDGTSPVLSAGLEAGLLGALLIVFEQILRLFLNTAGFGVLFAGFRIVAWLGAGALAVYLLFRDGIRERSQQVQAGILAGLITGLATGAILVIFSLLNKDSVDTIPL